MVKAKAKDLFFLKRALDDKKKTRSSTKIKKKKRVKDILRKYSSRFEILNNEIFTMTTRAQKRERNNRTRLFSQMTSSSRKKLIEDLSEEWSSYSYINFLKCQKFSTIQEDLISVIKERREVHQEIKDKRREQQLKNEIEKLYKVGVLKGECQNFVKHQKSRKVYQIWKAKELLEWLNQNSYHDENPMEKKIQCQVCFEEDARQKQFLNGSIGGITPFLNEDYGNFYHLNCPFKSCKTCIKKYLEDSIDAKKTILRCPGVHANSKRCSHTFSFDEISEIVSKESLEKLLETCSTNYQERLDSIMSSDSSLREFVENNCKPCPRCKVIVSRSEGCDEISCRCGESFCYQCGKTYNECKCS